MLPSADFWEKEWQDFKKTNCTPTHKKSSQSEYWDRRAADFARSTLGPEKKPRLESVFKLLNNNEVLKPGLKVLDIGCGPGSFAIPFASLSLEVTALDPSPRMLELLNENLPPDLSNRVHTVEGQWEDLDPASLQWEKEFDLVFASMCPGVNSRDGIEKMMACSRRWCYVSAFSGPRHYQVYDKVFQVLYSHPYPNHFNDIIFHFNLVYALGYKPELSFAQLNASPQEDKQIFLLQLKELLPASPPLTPEKEKMIEEIVDLFTKNGQTSQPVSSNVGMMLWDVNRQQPPVS